MPKATLIRCKKCNIKWEKAKIERYCSNCFCCTGCERYVCPGCDEVLIVKPIKKMN